MPKPRHTANIAPRGQRFRSVNAVTFCRVPQLGTRQIYIYTVCHMEAHGKHSATWPVDHGRLTSSYFAVWPGLGTRRNLYICRVPRSVAHGKESLPCVLDRTHGELPRTY